MVQGVGGAEARRHEGRVAVDVRSTRRCSNGLEIAAENGERVRVAFALDCCDHEAMSFVATTSGITGEDVRNLMVAAVKYSFGAVNQLPAPIEWLTDNGSRYLTRETRCFAREIGLTPRTTPLKSPQSNGMAKAFVRTLKRDYVRVLSIPDAQSVLHMLPFFAGALQRAPSPSRAGLPLPARVHRPINLGDPVRSLRGNNISERHKTIRHKLSFGTRTLGGRLASCS